MKIVYKKLDDLYRAYSTTSMNIDGVKHYFFASEEKNYPCYAYSGKDFKKREIVWEDGGGCMSIIPLTKRENQFIAVQDFYLKVSPSKSKLVWGSYDKDEGFVIRDLLYLPFLHRFDVYVVDGVEYLICSTIADDKNDKEDWSRSGSIYVGLLPSDLTKGVSLTKIKDGIFRNHGYMKKIEDGITYGYFSGDQGVFKLTCKGDVKDWFFTQIFDKPTGEVAFCDVNNDGVDEMMTIEQFHGNNIKIYELVSGRYEEVFSYPKKIDFAHTIVGCKLAGINCFAAGYRREEAEIFIVTYDNGYKVQVVDSNCGPANIAIVNEKDCDLILASNHTRNETAVYKVYKEEVL